MCDCGKWFSMNIMCYACALCMPFELQQQSQFHSIDNIEEIV